MDSEEKIMAILNFQAMTESSDEEMAIRYLSNNAWDVTKAVEQYLSEKIISQISAPSPPRPQVQTTQPHDTRNLFDNH